MKESENRSHKAFHWHRLERVCKRGFQIDSFWI